MASLSAMAQACGNLELKQLASMNNGKGDLQKVWNYIASNANETTLRLRAAAAVTYHLIARVEMLEAKVEALEARMEEANENG